MPGKKSNNNKSYSQHEAWQKGKRIGRHAQVWVPATETVPGHWEKTKLYFVGTACAEQLEKVNA